MRARNEAVARKFFQFLAVLAFSPAHDGREDHDAVAGLGQFPCRMARTIWSVDWREMGLPHFGAMRRADRAVDHAQVIVDFGDGAHRGARRTRRGLLLDGDRRRKAFDGIHFRALHLVEELPRVGGKRFDVAALALGVNRVETRATICPSRKAP